MAAALLVWSVAAASAPAIAVNDDNGQHLVLAAPARRIITLAPSLTELAFVAGAGDRVVAVSAWSDYPRAALRLPQVADAAGVSLEALLELRPDLVIAWKSGNREIDIKRIAAFGIPVLVLEVAHLADISRAVRAIGTLAGSDQKASAAAMKIDDTLASLRTANQGKRRVTVFFEISRLPLMTVNRHHAIDEVISLCGGENIFRSKELLVFSPTMEELVRLQPQVILFPANQAVAPATDYRGLQAWANQRIYRVSADALLRTGPRMVEGAVDVCTRLDEARESLRADGINSGQRN
jgi:ABC-type Fe3+-hydroxamate transport system substrate-binding protein